MTKVYNLRCRLLSVKFFIVLTVLNPPLYAQEQKTWQEGELKKLEGRWTTLREEKTDQDKIRRRRVEVEVAGRNLQVFILDENDARPWEGPPLKVIGIERGADFASSSLLKLDPRPLSTRVAEVYYDFVGEKLILVGGLGHRPFEGFRLSGEYKRLEKPK
jgi:hypothetical protein